MSTMSLKTLPLLFINLGGEMLYILDQRLKAQNIPAEKSKKGKQRPKRSLYLVYTAQTKLLSADVFIKDQGQGCDGVTSYGVNST